MSALSAWKGLVRMISFSNNEDRADLFTQWMDFSARDYTVFEVTSILVFISWFCINVQPVESSLLSFATSLEKPLSQLQTSVANCIFPPKNPARQRIFPNFSQKPQGYNLSGIRKISRGLRGQNKCIIAKK